MLALSSHLRMACLHPATASLQDHRPRHFCDMLSEPPLLTRNPTPHSQYTAHSEKKLRAILARQSSLLMTHTERAKLRSSLELCHMLEALTSWSSRIHKCALTLRAYSSQHNLNNPCTVLLQCSSRSTKAKRPEGRDFGRRRRTRPRAPSPGATPATDDPQRPSEA